ncbi:outer membrane protein assembly factor BamE [Marinobacterium sp. LSUCC0821]|jgi:outer membrane protein assembly factor BamE|uniref:outer membrane protein assembly factor BamE n=1 Tax=Marinobacterium sp. LSUCC0821 TaxID=2668067 RepID=UPI0014513C50|nr:outer membrane protein assembly factor BamE [Marinobacterium sp. LSUCC0821]QJD72082.1 outer membrane protein assembly factor BamE [Marinobacterium sp. LSUCC0821]
MRKLIVGSFAALLISGCTYFPGVYKMDVPQGNHITQEMVDELRPGMTPSQVRYVLGTPLLTDTFNKNRWDYVYQMVKEDKVVELRQFSVYFDNERLVRLEGDYKPN